jgi:polysaccharide biosynthesis transport protein
MTSNNDSQSVFSQHPDDLPPSLPAGASLAASDSNDSNLDIGWLFGVVRRRLPMMLIIGVTLSTVFGGILVKQGRAVDPEYEGSFRLLIEPSSAEGRLIRQFLMAQDTGADLSKIKIEETGLVDYETQIRVLKSPKLLEPILGRLKADYPRLSYKELDDKLKLDRISVDISGKEFGTKIIEVKYTDPKPEKVLTILKATSDYYLQYSLEERIGNLKQGIEFIEQQLPRLQKRVDSLSQELQELRQQENIIDPYPQSQEMSQQIGVLSQQKLDNQKSLAELRSMYANLQAQLAAGNPIPVLSQASQYQQLLIEAQKLESQVAAETGRLQPNSLPMLSLREQQQAMRELLNREAEGVLGTVAERIAALEAQQQTIDQAQAQLEAKIQRWPVALRENNDLQKQLEVATSTLTDFLVKREALSVDAAQQEVPWLLIAPPDIPRDKQGKPVPATQAQTQRQIAIATILSMLLGIAAGFLIEVLHTVFHTAAEVKAAARLPLLADIPHTKKTKPQANIAEVPTVSAGGIWRFIPFLGNGYSGDRSMPFYESFRSLYTNIRLLASESSLKSLTIASATPADGKSTVAVHLALTAATIGVRVLLVDTDLRSPKIHQKLSLANSQGLCDLLTSECSLNDLIQKSPLDENLFVLTAGAIPLDSIKLLSSKKMQQVMEQFNSFFDLVIYDTPPLTGLADSHILAANTDGLVLVVALERTDRTLLTVALEGLRLSGASVLGVVANHIKA